MKTRTHNHFTSVRVHKRSHKAIICDATAAMSHLRVGLVARACINHACVTLHLGDTVLDYMLCLCCHHP